jgi:hypothetical protein
MSDIPEQSQIIAPSSPCPHHVKHFYPVWAHSRDNGLIAHGLVEYHDAERPGKAFEPNASLFVTLHRAFVIIPSAVGQFCRAHRAKAIDDNLHDPRVTNSRHHEIGHTG